MALAFFYPFAHMSNLGRRRVLRAEIEAPTYAATYRDPRGAEEHLFACPRCRISSSPRCTTRGPIAYPMFALNRSVDEAMPLEVVARGFAGLALALAQALHDRDLDAADTEADALRIRPLPLEDVVIEADRLHAVLPLASWNVIRLAPAR